MNVAGIREMLQLVEETLGQSDLLPAFEKVVAAARALRRRPRR